MKEQKTGATRNTTTNAKQWSWTDYFLWLGLYAGAFILWKLAAYMGAFN